MLKYLAYSCPRALLISALAFSKVFYNYEITFKLILGKCILVFWPLSLIGQHAMLTFKAGAKDNQCWSFSDDLHQVRTYLLISFVSQNKTYYTPIVLKYAFKRVFLVSGLFILTLVLLMAICILLVWWHLMISFLFIGKTTWLPILAFTCSLKAILKFPLKQH